MKQNPTSFRTLGSIVLPTNWKRVPGGRLLWGILGLDLVLLVCLGTIANPDAAGSNRNEVSEDQVSRKAPPGMAWIPGGRF
jgi:hypothetical protein